METVYFYENGRKRLGEKAICKQCGKEFIRRLHGIRNKKKIYCSTKCSGASKKKSVIVECHNCGKQTSKRLSRLKNAIHGLYFCSRKCKDFAQSLEGGCVEIQPNHYGTGTGEWGYRDRFRSELLKGCKCGETKIYKLVVHHKDRNRHNNKKDNLEVVCWNCHAVRHLRLENGNWIFSQKHLTPRDMIEQLT